MSAISTRIEKLNEIKSDKQVDAFLISSASTVKYFSGYFFYFEYGASPFHLLPAVLLVVPGEDTSLVLADNEMGQSSYIDSSVNIIPYESYTYENAPDPSAACLKTINTFIKKNKLGSARIGIEGKDLPYDIVNGLSKSIQWVDISDDITRFKMIKDPDEIENIKKAAALADIGQQAVLRYAKAGITELQLFARVHSEMEAAAGTRIPVMSDLSSGAGTNSGGGMPTDKMIQHGDLVLSDFQPCLQGYWGDSCNTMVVGTPTADQKKTFERVREGLEIGISAIKPGVRANAIDQLLRHHIGNYPHHSGHSVGTSYHELPRITPYNKIELASGMVLALEPAIYKPEYGIRLEHLMLVTEDACEVLTQFKHRFEQ